MRKSMLAAIGAAGLFAAGLAQAQTFPNTVGNPGGVLINPGPSGPVDLSNNYILLERSLGNGVAGFTYLPMSAFAGAADVNATNTSLAVTNANLAATNNNLASTNANLLGLQNYAINVRNLALNIRRDAFQGTAAAMAISSAPMPSAPGRTSWTVNAAEFNNQPGWGGSVAHRFDVTVPFAITAGFAFSGANNGGRVGFSGEF